MLCSLLALTLWLEAGRAKPISIVPSRRVVSNDLFGRVSASMLRAALLACWVLTLQTHVVHVPGSPSTKVLSSLCLPALLASLRLSALTLVVGAIL